jgi:hypothetical protein
LNAETIRYYESHGLLREAERDANNYRRFGEDARKRLDFIGRAKHQVFAGGDPPGARPHRRPQPVPRDGPRPAHRRADQPPRTIDIGTATVAKLRCRHPEVPVQELFVR